MARRAALGLALLAALAACPSPSGSDGGADAGDGACGALDTRHKELLNAPTAAAVVKKEPTYPRDAGR